MLLGKCSAVIIVKFTIVCLHVMHETPSPSGAGLGHQRKVRHAVILGGGHVILYSALDTRLCLESHTNTHSFHRHIIQQLPWQKITKPKIYHVIQHSFSIGIRTLAVLTQAHQTLRFKITVRYDGALNHILCDVRNKKIHCEGSFKTHTDIQYTKPHPHLHLCSNMCMDIVSDFDRENLSAEMHSEDRRSYNMVETAGFVSMFWTHLN